MNKYSYIERFLSLFGVFFMVSSLEREKREDFPGGCRTSNKQSGLIKSV